MALSLRINDAEGILYSICKRILHFLHIRTEDKTNFIVIQAVFDYIPHSHEMSVTSLSLLY